MCARTHTRTVGENDKKYGRFKVAMKYFSRFVLSRVCDHSNDTAPRETVSQRAQRIVRHKKADRVLKAIVLLKAKKELKQRP